MIVFESIEQKKIRHTQETITKLKAKMQKQIDAREKYINHLEAHQYLVYYSKKDNFKKAIEEADKL